MSFEENNTGHAMKLSNKRDVRILLVGERGVGKTSLILSLVSEEFAEDVPARAEEITIPADVTPEKVPTHIVDYSAVEQTEEQLAEEIQRANVICVVYSVDNEESFDVITSKWLPLIRESLEGHSSRPVILVCNKVDLVDYSSIETMIAVMEDFPEVESCVECSAKSMRNISELFYYAQKSVLHPPQPLYVIAKKELTPGCKKALSRIFKICDSDNDGVLNDNELNGFQRKCFNAPLQPQVLEDVKSLIKRNISEGLSKNGVTLPGFLFLHKLFIERGHSETTWTVLRRFGYDDDLNLSKDYLVPPLKVPPGCSTELSHKGQQFFASLFDRHDRDRDGALCPAEVEELFSICPASAWGPEVHLNVPTKKRDKWMSQRGFLCHWTLTTLYDHTRTLEYLGYFGYPAAEHESQITAIHVTREKRIDWSKRQTSRNVYQCHVLGGANVGKSKFCSALIGEPTEEAGPQCTINIVHVYGQEKFLVLRDVSVKDIEPVDLACDVLCLMYDVSNRASFEQVAEAYLKYFAESKIPVLVVGSKSDQPEVKQSYSVQPDEFCNRHKLPPPSSCSLVYKTHKEIYLKLATMAAFPCFQPAWVMFYRKQQRHLEELGILPMDLAASWWKAGVGIAAATAVGFFLVKALRPDVSIR